MSAADKPQILLVDDEAPILMTYKLIFEQEGYRVTCARTTAEANQALERDTFDLLICDMALEGRESGLDIIRSARQENPHLPCILLTGYPDTEMPDAAREEGVQVLFKPIDVPSVLSAVDFLLRRSQHERDRNNRPA